MINTIRLTMAQAVIKYLKNQHSVRDGKAQPFFGGCFGIFGHADQSHPDRWHTGGPSRASRTNPTRTDLLCAKAT